MLTTIESPSPAGAPRRAATLGSVALALSVIAGPFAPTPSAAQAAPARATSAPPQSRNTVRLDLADAIARAVGQSEEVRLARSQVDLADAQVTAARSAALPHIDGNLSYTRTFDSPFNTGTGFTLPDSLRFEPDTTLPFAERGGPRSGTRVGRLTRDGCTTSTPVVLVPQTLHRLGGAMPLVAAVFARRPASGDAPRQATHLAFNRACTP